MADEAESGGGDNKKKMMIIIGAVVALLAINVGAMMFIVGSKDEGGGGGEHGSAEQPAAVPLSAKPIYIPLDPAFVVNFEDQSLVRFLQVTVEAETKDPTVEEAIKHYMPEIRNNLVLLFSSQDYQTISSLSGKQKIRTQALEEIQSVLQKHIGKPGVDEIYFTSFVMQ